MCVAVTRRAASTCINSWPVQLVKLAWRLEGKNEIQLRRFQREPEQWVLRDRKLPARLVFGIVVVATCIGAPTTRSVRLGLVYFLWCWVPYAIKQCFVFVEAGFKIQGRVRGGYCYIFQLSRVPTKNVG